MEVHQNKCGGAVSLIILGTPHNWGTGRIPINQEPTPEQNEVLARIGSIAETYGVKALYGPDPSKSNAEFISHESPDFTQEIILPTRFKPNLPLYRGRTVYADAIDIPKGKGLWMISADCALLIVRSPETEKVVASHAGRDSLIDQGLIRKNEPRRHFSVVDVVLEQFPKEEWSSLECELCFSISAEYFLHPFNHPEHGENNQKMVEYIYERWTDVIRGPKEDGSICLKRLMRAQLIEKGVDEKNILQDAIDTHNDRDASNEHAFWSTRRGNRERNGLIVINYGSRNRRM